MSNDRAQWLLAGLLAAWSPADKPWGPSPSNAVPKVDDLAPLWHMMQTVGSATQQQAMPGLQATTVAAAASRQQASAHQERLQSLAALLICAVSEGPPMQAAAALLAAGGYTQGLRAGSSGDAVQPVLLHIAAWAPRACGAALAAQLVATSGSARQMQAATLLRDAAALAALVASQVLARHLHSCPVSIAQSARL